eukprot:10511490-Alexandrium_andersonii.AAC.1
MHTASSRDSPSACQGCRGACWPAPPGGGPGSGVPCCIGDGGTITLSCSGRGGGGSATGV